MWNWSVKEHLSPHNALQIKCKWSIYRWWWSCPLAAALALSLNLHACRARWLSSGRERCIYLSMGRQTVRHEEHMDKEIELNSWAVQEHPKGTVSVNLNWQPAAAAIIKFRSVELDFFFNFRNNSACDAGMRVPQKFHCACDAGGWILWIEITIGSSFTLNDTTWEICRWWWSEKNEFNSYSNLVWTQNDNKPKTVYYLVLCSIYSDGE